jgi:outer membrane protein, multidrug efflux system
MYLLKLNINHSMSMYKRNYWPFIFSILLMGCTVGPKYSPPDASIPCDWHSPVSEGMHPAPSDSFCWWESFNDPLLNSLIERAASQNLDLYIAVTRILEARTAKEAKCGDVYPHVDFSASYDHVRYSKDALMSGLLSKTLPINSRSIKRNVNFFEVGFDADWEIDLFGLTAHELNALKAKEEASEENLCDVWITLSAEVAKNYIELRGLQYRLSTLEKNVEAQKNAVQLNEELVGGGVISEIDSSQSENQLSILTAQKPLIELAITKSIHRLSILLGYVPGNLFDELALPCSLPMLPCDKPIGVPSELLRRRPDIRKAERELAAATERVGSAIASLFPRFSLRGFIGDISTHLGSLFNPASATWLAGPQLLLPIFNSRLILQDINYNKILTQKAIYEYQNTVLKALEETENAIASFHFELEHNHHLSQASRSSQKALELTQQLFQLGIKDNLEVLRATGALIETEDAYIQSQIDLLLHYISLYKALGGCW